MARPTKPSARRTGAAILVAAGPGKRLSAGQPKAFVELAGRPLLLWSLTTLLRSRGVSRVVVVVPAGFEKTCRDLLRRYRFPMRRVEVATGGEERQDSVRAGLERLADANLVAVHDAARPFVALGQINAVLRAATQRGAAILAIPSSDTVKEVDVARRIVSTPPRDRLWLAQTPQVFHAEVLRRAHFEARTAVMAATDDAALVERLGIRVFVVEGGPENRKITTPDDLEWACWYAEKLHPVRVKKPAQPKRKRRPS